MKPTPSRTTASSRWESMLDQQLYALSAPRPLREHRWHPVRRWRFDFAWPLHRLAVEVEGAVWVRGRHTRGSGYIADAEKYNAATICGWRVLRYTPETIRTGAAAREVAELLGAPLPADPAV